MIALVTILLISAMKFADMYFRPMSRAKVKVDLGVYQHIDTHSVIEVVAYQDGVVMVSNGKRTWNLDYKTLTIEYMYLGKLG